jgi:hypothetical protein
MGSAWASKPEQVMFVEAPARAPSRPLPRIFSAAAAPSDLARGPVESTESATAAPSAPYTQAPPDPAAVLAEAQADALAAPPLPEFGGVRYAIERPPRAPRARRIYAAADRSSVEPGSAVRVVASAMDPEGHPLMVDLTSFGSQHYYRTGTFLEGGSRQRLFTSVVQRGERLWVTASLNRRFEGPETGTIEMRSGETRDLVLGNGQVVTITPTLRPETPEEAAGAWETLRRADADMERSSRDARRLDRQRCRTDAC